MTKPQGRDRLLVLSIALLGRELIGVAAFRKGDGYSERPEEHDPSAIHARASRAAKRGRRRGAGGDD